MGLVGLFVSLGFAVGPAVGAYIAALVSVEIMFYTSSAAAFFSVLVLAGMKETLASKEQFSATHLKIDRHDIYEPRVFSPALVMMLTGFSFGTILTVIPDFSDFLEIANRGVFFTAFTIGIPLSKSICGKSFRPLRQS